MFHQKRTIGFIVVAVCTTALIGGWQMYLMAQQTESQTAVALDAAATAKAHWSASDKTATRTLGVHVSNVSGSLQKHLRLPAGVGLIIEHVVEGGAAARAGLQPHDVLHKFEDQLLVNSQQLATLVNIQEADAEVKLTVIREGEPLSVKAVLKPQPVAETTSGFDAYYYFHGIRGRHELQKCSHCHQGFGDDSETDNYYLFHGQAGNVELQNCAACHARVVFPLTLPEY